MTEIKDLNKSQRSHLRDTREIIVVMEQDSIVVQDKLRNQTVDGAPQGNPLAPAIEVNAGRRLMGLPRICRGQ
jgi:hypothetical protein